MRKIVYPLFVAGAIFLAACGGEKKAEETAATTDSTAAPAAEATPSEETPAAPAEEATASTETTPAASGTAAPKTSSAKTDAKGKTEEAAPTKNIIKTALDAGRFTELATAVGATGLGQTLGNPGPLTLFAPNDEAFAKLDPAAKANFFKPENKQKLINVLKLHVTNGNNTIESLVGPAFATFNGKSISVKKDGKGYIVGKSAKVVNANIKCTNGMIHEIDALLIPGDY